MFECNSFLSGWSVVRQSSRYMVLNDPHRLIESGDDSPVAAIAGGLLPITIRQREIRRESSVAAS